MGKNGYVRPARGPQGTRLSVQHCKPRIEECSQARNESGLFGTAGRAPTTAQRMVQHLDRRHVFGNATLTINVVGSESFELNASRWHRNGKYVVCKSNQLRAAA